jgi:hypothetical protein
MYLDIWQSNTERANLKSIQIFTGILSGVILITGILAESSVIPIGSALAVIMMMAFWLLCVLFQPLLQKIRFGPRLILFLALAAVYWFGIFVHFTQRY